MPRRCSTDPRLPDLLRSQDWVVHRDQALDAGLTRRAIDHRLSTGEWQVLLPSVYLAQPSEPSRRQMLIGAQRYAGPASAVDGTDACKFHGIKAVAIDEDTVGVVEPWGETARSSGFVVVRRTVSPIRSVSGQYVRFVDAASAVIAATRRMHADRPVMAALSDALQRRVTTYDDLLRAHIQGSPRHARRADVALRYLKDGARSAAEADFLRLAAASPILPKPYCNALLRLPDGELISPDALFLDAGVVHETNGRIAHQREGLFDDMQARHDVMTSAGLTVLHNPPSRLASHARLVIVQVERCYTRHRGSGLPLGVTVVRLAN
jgi:hypothetical protein